MQRLMTHPNSLPKRSILENLAAVTIGMAIGIGAASPAYAEFGFLNLAEGWKCEGQFQGNNGNGLCVLRDEVNPGESYKYYRGDVRNGTFTGHGVLVYENDDRYQGQMRNGRPHGKGVFISVEENRRYEGDFSNGEFHGRGTYTFADGSRYVGQFAGSQPHGIGTFTAYQNGKPAYTYTGRFYLGTINGNGVFTSADGMRCKGVFYSNAITGRATCTYPTGSTFKTYTGEIRNGRPDGKGRAVFSNGKTYSGQFREGQPGLSDSGS